MTTEQANGQQAMKDLYASRETAISKLMKTVEDLQSRIQIIEAAIGSELLDVVTRAENLWKDQEIRITKLEKRFSFHPGHLHIGTEDDGYPD